MKNIIDIINESKDNITFGHILELAVDVKLSDLKFPDKFNSANYDWFSPEFDSILDALRFVDNHKNDIIDDGETEYDNFEDFYWNDFYIDNIKCSIPTKEELSY